MLGTRFIGHTVPQLPQLIHGVGGSFAETSSFLSARRDAAVFVIDAVKSYVCPAKIPLKQGFKTMNTLIKAENKKRRAEVKK